MANQLTVSPDADPETTSVDGYIESVGVGASISSHRNGSEALTAFPSGATLRCALLAAGTTFPNDYAEMSIFYILFDISAIPSDAYITDVDLRLYCTAASGDWDVPPYITNAEPASDTNVATADFDYTVWDTINHFTTQAPTSWTTSAYNTRPVNATGLAYINTQLAGDGIVRLGLAFPSFVDGSSHGTWVADNEDSLDFDSADGTNAPELILDYVIRRVVDETVQVQETIVSVFPVEAVIDEAVNIVETIVHQFGITDVVDEVVNIVENVVGSPFVNEVVDETLNIVEAIATNSFQVISKIIASAVRGTRVIQSYIITD